MTRINGSRHRGTRHHAGSILLTALIAMGPAHADTIFTVNGVDVDSTVVDIFFESQLGNANAQATPEQRTMLLSQLKDIYLLATTDKARELANDPSVKAQLELQRHGLLAQAAATAFMESVQVSEEELQAEYEEQVGLSPPLDFKARHILVASQGEATDLIGQLNEGADFAELATTNSTGPSGPNGGDLGWFSPNQMVAPFSNALQGLEDGEYTSTPVQTQFGWHVILREDSRQSIPPTFESVRDEIVRRVQNEKFQAHLESLRTAASQP